jgi:hypothetical protein
MKTRIFLEGFTVYEYGTYVFGNHEKGKRKGGKNERKRRERPTIKGKIEVQRPK